MLDILTACNADNPMAAAAVAVSEMATQLPYAFCAPFAPRFVTKLSSIASKGHLFFSTFDQEADSQSCNVASARATLDKETCLDCYESGFSGQ